MSVNKFKIPLRDVGTSGTSLNIPVSLDFTPVDNSELIQTKFIDDEKEKSINPIVDYKKIRFFPADNNWNIIRKIKYNLNFFNNINNGYFYSNPPSYNGASPYKSLGFSFDDIFCRTDRVMNSFLRFNLYDTPNSDKKLLGYTNIYTQIMGDQENEYGFVLPINECPVSFILGDATLEPETIHEGYYIYWFKDLVDNSPSQEYVMYMETTYQNSGNGEVMSLYPQQTVDYTTLQLGDITGPTGGRYLKVILKNDNGIYKYKFAPITTQDGSNGGAGGVNLNPQNNLNDVPYITFWQIQPNKGN